MAAVVEVTGMNAVMAAIQTEAAAISMAYEGVQADTVVILVER